MQLSPLRRTPHFSSAGAGPFVEPRLSKSPRLPSDFQLDRRYASEMGRKGGKTARGDGKKRKPPAAKKSVRKK